MKGGSSSPREELSEEDKKTELGERYCVRSRFFEVTAAIGFRDGRRKERLTGRIGPEIVDDVGIVIVETVTVDAQVAVWCIILGMFSETLFSGVAA